MAITGNPGDLATGGFGTGVRGVAATPRDVANAVARGNAMAAARAGGGGEGGNRGTSVRSPLAVYGDEFTFTNEELNNAILSNAPALLGSRMNPSVLELMAMQKKTNASPELQGIAAAMRAPFMAGYQQSLAPTGLLDSAVNAVSAPASGFPKFDRLTTVPSYPEVGNVLMGETVNSPYNNITNSFYNSILAKTPSYGELENVAMGSTVGSPYNNITGNFAPAYSPVNTPSGMTFNGGLLGTPSAAPQQDMGPLSDAAISAALNYQNTPLENDIAYLASRIGPSASPEALALVEPRFVTELAKSIRAAEAETGETARINDMYRSPETQGQLYAELKAQDPNYMVAPAGRSLHQGAFSADIARGPILNYMRANVPSSLNFPYGQKDLVHVQLSNPEMAALGYKMTPKGVDKSPFGAFTSTIGDGGFMFAGSDLGQIAPIQVAAAPSPAPVQAVMPQNQTRVAATPSLPPRTPTPSLLGRFATALTGIPGYDTGPGLLGGGFKPAEVGTQLLASSQPQVVNPVAAEAPPVNRPTAAPVRLASLLLEAARERSGEGRRDRRRRKPSTTTEQTMSDTIGGLLA